MSEEKLNILLVSDMSKVGGTEIATYITAKQLKSLVESICVFGKKGLLSTSLDDLNVDQIDAESHSKNPFKIFQYIIKLIKVINKYQINIIHAQMARPIPLLWFATWFIKNKNIKIFWTSRGLNHSTYQYVIPFFNKIGVRGLGNCKLEQQKLIRYGFTALRTSYAYNAYRLNPKTACREKSIKQTITIGTLSALREDRCVDLFLKTAKFIIDSKSSQSFEFVIGGDGAYRKQLEELAANLGIAYYVKFLGNIVDVEVFMQKVDIFISPIVVDGDSGAGVSNSIVEAMVTKTPVCAFDAAAIGEIVINGQTGYLVEPRNIEAMVKAILATVANKQLTQKYVENAYNLIIEECDPQSYAKKLIYLYKNL